MADRSVVVRLRAEVDAYVAGMKKAQAATSDFARGVAGSGQASRADIEKVGHTALAMSAGLAIGLGLSAKAAIDWESAWAGVTKTVDGSTAEMAELEEGLRNLAKELPATHGEIAAVAEAAGQLGIQRAAIEDFTRTMVDLGETTNLTADQAATSLARMANIMQTPQGEIDRMASTLVALGNAGASTESEILDMALRIAGSAKQVGISEAATLGFANALSSVGIEAEAGGTAISRVFSTIASAVADGGDGLEAFAEIANMSGTNFAAAFKDDAAGATIAFIEGLEGISASGENVFAVLEDLELGDIRVRDALLRAAGAGDLFRESLALGAQEWETNNALQSEAEKRYETTASQLEVLRNNVVDLAIGVGDQLLPAIGGTAEALSTMARGMGELEGGGKVAVTALGGIATAGLGLIGMVGTFGPKIKDFRDGLVNMGGLGATLGNNLGKATAALGGVGVAVGAVSYVLGVYAKAKQDAIDLSKEYAEAIGSETGALEENIDSLTARKLGEFSGTDRLRELGADFDVLLTGIRETGGGLEDLSKAFDVGDSPTRFATQLEDAGIAGTAFGDELMRIYEAMGPGQSAPMDEFLALLRELGVGYEDGAVLAANLAAAEQGVGNEAATAAPKLGRMAESLGLNAEEAAAAKEEFEGLLDAYRGAVDPLFGMLDALEANREAMGAEAAARAEGLIAIEEAAENLADAEADLQEARGTPDNADAIAAAEERVADARERLTEAEADGVISADELARMNRDVAQSALDVEVASRELAAAVADGTVDVEAAKGMLAEWVAQGLITADQAYAVGEQFGTAAGKADEFAGDYVANAYANTGPAIAAFNELQAKIKETYEVGGNAPISINQAERLLSPQRKAAGGYIEPIYRADGGWTPKGTDTVPAMLTPGEFVINAQAAANLGASNLYALNSGHISPAMSGGSVSSIDNSRRFQVDAPITVMSTEPRRSAVETAYELRKLALAVR